MKFQAVKNEVLKYNIWRFSKSGDLWSFATWRWFVKFRHVWSERFCCAKVRMWCWRCGWRWRWRWRWGWRWCWHGAGAGTGAGMDYPWGFILGFPQVEFPGVCRSVSDRGIGVLWRSIHRCALKVDSFTSIYGYLSVVPKCGAVQSWHQLVCFTYRLIRWSQLQCRVCCLPWLANSAPCHQTLRVKKQHTK